MVAMVLTASFAAVDRTNIKGMIRTDDVSKKITSDLFFIIGEFSLYR